MKRASAALLVFGWVTSTTIAEAEPIPAGLKVLVRTGTDSPLPGLRYRRIRTVAALKGGDVAFGAQLETADQGSQQDAAIREGTTRAAIMSPGTAKPGGGTFGDVEGGVHRARGNFVLFSTVDTSLSETTWWGYDGDSGTSRRLAGSNDQFGGKPVGTLTPQINAQGLALFSAFGGMFAVNSAGAIKPAYTHLGAINGLGAEWTVPLTAAGTGRGFLDENGLVTAIIRGTHKVGATDVEQLHTMHGGVDAAYSELPWAKDRVDTGPNTHYSQAILSVGRSGAMVGVKTEDDTATSTTKEQYHSGDGTSMTPAFELVTVSSTTTPITLDGTSVTRVGETLPIDNGSFLFTAGTGSDGTTFHLFLWSGGAARRLAGPGMDAPGTGGKFDSIGKLTANRRGQVMFTGVVGGKNGIFFAEPGQAPTLLALEGQEVSLDGGPAPIRFGPDVEDGLNDDGSVAFAASTNASPPINVILGRGDASPTASADLELTGLLSKDGSLVFTVKNLGPSTANGVRIRFVGEDVRLFNPRPECQGGTTEVNCQVGTIAVGQAIEQFVFDNPNPGQKIEGTVTGASDPNLANNTVTLVYQPKSSQDAVDEGCAAAPTHSKRGTSALALGVVALVAALRRRIARRRGGDSVLRRWSGH